jgi:hypothetical protein
MDRSTVSCQRALAPDGAQDGSRVCQRADPATRMPTSPGGATASANSCCVPSAAQPLPPQPGLGIILGTAIRGLSPAATLGDPSGVQSTAVNQKARVFFWLTWGHLIGTRSLAGEGPAPTGTATHFPVPRAPEETPKSGLALGRNSYQPTSLFSQVRQAKIRVHRPNVKMRAETKANDQPPRLSFSEIKNKT